VTRHRTTMVLLLLAMTGAAPLGSDPTRACLGALSSSIDALGSPRAGEVASEVDALKDILRRLDGSARTLAVDRESAESDQKRLDWMNRERTSKLAEIDRQAGILGDEESEMQAQAAKHQSELAIAEAACGNITSEAQERDCKERQEVINRRAAIGNAQIAELKRRRADLDVRRGEIAAEIPVHARNAFYVAKRRAFIDWSTSQVLGECAAAQSRALALAQIGSAPARTIAYAPPEAVANKVLTGLVLEVGKGRAEHALTATEVKQTMRVLSKAGAKVSVKTAGTLVAVASGALTALAALDLVGDVGHAGVDQRDAEVTKNLFLIGDYADVMRARIKAGGDTSDPTYIAMRDEMERLRGEMPSTTTEVFARSFLDAAALGQALASAAGSFTKARVLKVNRQSSAGIAYTRHFSNRQRKAIAAGRGGLTFLRGRHDAQTAAAAEAAVKSGAEQLMNIHAALRTARDEEKKK
jgi:hypothetical protein